MFSAECPMLPMGLWPPAFWVQHEGMQIFSIDVQLGGLRFPIGGGDHKGLKINCDSMMCL
ncbi:hypothetical protein HanHA300_Chr15g0548251 [Helianthus annuus]|nr:hypothetical protein HanHA300_Chr15g0548251 [Helianthus annuus]KAJ0647000.1 hypothetical protein HanLR1_Chr15g0557211 [Helianthus annuus]KAJ0650899.1 hypothetical protein HanOQP8_Chr15g0555291 [Helianthus annuus]